MSAPAFPNHPGIQIDGDLSDWHGMDTRTWIAGMALSGILSRSGSVAPEQIAERAIAVADATITQLSKGKNQ